MFPIIEVLRERGDEDPNGLVYDAERDLYRFPDGRFVLSREHANWRTLKQAGFFSEWDM